MTAPITDAPFTPCEHRCMNCRQMDCMCAGGDGRYKRCAHVCNQFGMSRGHAARETAAKRPLTAPITDADRVASTITDEERATADAVLAAINSEYESDDDTGGNPDIRSADYIAQALHAARQDGANGASAPITDADREAAEQFARSVCTRWTIETGLHGKGMCHHCRRDAQALAQFRATARQDGANAATTRLSDPAGEMPDWLYTAWVDNKAEVGAWLAAYRADAKKDGGEAARKRVRGTIERWTRINRECADVAKIGLQFDYWNARRIVLAELLVELDGGEG